MALYVLLGLVLWWLLNGYIDPSAIKDHSKEAAVKKDLIQALGLIMAGVAGAVGIFFTWRNLQQNQANLRLTQEGMERTQVGTQESLQLTREQVQLSREEQELARQGQITERFTRAIDQLGATNSDGSPSMEVRLGGIYTLERIAKEFEEYYWPIIEILTAYVREHGVWTPEKAEYPLDKSIPVRDATLEAILTVLWKRSGHFGNGEPQQIALPRVDLRIVNFKGGNFDQAVFWQANLEGAQLSEASLRGAQFQDTNLAAARPVRANLAEANPQGANLEGAQLWEANLEGADLSKANLRGANLVLARLDKTHLMEANLEGAYLEVSSLVRADLREASLKTAWLRRANLADANVRGANLEGANLIQANLKGTILEGCNLAGSGLERAYFEDAYLEGANLKGAYLNRALYLYQWQIERAYGDEHTQLPSHLKRPASWTT